MEESQALCTKPKEVEALCKESAGAKRANATEEAAACFLERREYEILDRNWKCIAGEADIVALQDDTLCFIEVKTRKDAQKGFPSEAVDMRKRSRYERIAACYLKDHDYADVRVRFDVIAILVLGEGRAFLRHHLNAFGSM